MKVIIVGGVAGGASAAARMRRLDENAEIVLFERGEYISFANCRPSVLHRRCDPGGRAPAGDDAGRHEGYAFVWMSASTAKSSASIGAAIR